MRPARAPFRRYLPLPVAGVLGIALNVLRQTDAGAKFLTAEHLIWGGFAVLGWFIGLLYGDLLNKNSDLLRWWRYRTRLFDVISIKAYPHPTERWLEHHVTLRMQFVKSIENASIQLCVREPGWLAGTKTLDLLNNVNKAKGSELTIVIAKVALILSPVYSDGRARMGASIEWGSPEARSHEYLYQMHAPSRCFATVVVQGKRNRQSHLVYLSTLALDEPYFIADEDNDRFYDGTD